MPRHRCLDRLIPVAVRPGACVPARGRSPHRHPSGAFRGRLAHGPDGQPEAGAASAATGRGRDGLQPALGRGVLGLRDRLPGRRQVPDVLPGSGPGRVRPGYVPGRVQRRHPLATSHPGYPHLEGVQGEQHHLDRTRVPQLCPLQGLQSGGAPRAPVQSAGRRAPPGPGLGRRHPLEEAAGGASPWRSTTGSPSSEASRTRSSSPAGTASPSSAVSARPSFGLAWIKGTGATGTT